MDQQPEPETNMNVKRVYNDMIDEEIDLDEPEDVPVEPTNLKNQPVDEVHHISDDSGDVPSPPDSENNVELDGMNEMNGMGGIQPMGLEAMNGLEGESLGLPIKEETVWEGYSPSDYQNLNISPEISSLFSYITSYKPEVIEIDTEIKPFIPEYIPAVGEVDAFLKIPRPDAEVEILGLERLDEPKLNQSKKAVINLLLAEHGKIHRKDHKEVHSIKNAHKNPREVSNWVENVEKIIATRHLPTVIYTNKMPDGDTLMQAWEPEFQEALRGMELPDSGVGIPVEDMAKYACALLDIPVHKENKNRNLIESLHVFFTLYSGFKANQHFQGGDFANQNNENVHSLKVG